MGTVIHESMIVTSWKKELLLEAYSKAVDYFAPNQVSGVTDSPVNGYYSFLISPSGSKIGWTEEKHHRTAMDDIEDWIRSKSYDDGSNSIEIARVKYGNECDSPEIKTSLATRPG